MASSRWTTIAVGVPTKNNENSIRQTLESLLNQTRKPDRIVVVDASSDRTREIVESIAANSEVPFDILDESHKGRGVSVARQQIYEACEEDILACLDTELVVGSEWVKTHVEFHQSNPECDILTAGTSFNGPVDDPTERDYFVQSNCSIKRDALAKVDGWDIWMGRGEDWDIRIRFAASGAKSHALRELQAERVVDEDPFEWVTKMLGRPSSIAFLRKYGIWYFLFHPVHVVGDAISTLSIVSCILGVLSMPLPVPSFVFFSFSGLGVLFYMYFHSLRPRGLRDFKRHPSRAVLYPIRLFVIGYTTIRELRKSDRGDWKYTGAEDLSAYHEIRRILG